MLSYTVTGMLLPTLALEKFADCVKVTLLVSPLTNPTRVPVLATAAVVAS